MATKKATSNTPAPARTSAPTAALRTRKPPQSRKAAGATAPAAAAQSPALTAPPNPWLLCHDVAGYGKLIEFGVAAAKSEEETDAAEGIGFHSTAILVALTTSPAFAAAREKFRADDHRNLHFGSGKRGTDPDEYDAPLRELCALYFQAGLLAAVRRPAAGPIR